MSIAMRRARLTARSVRAHAATERARVCLLCAKVEADLVELPEAERLIFLTDLGIAEPGLASIAREA